MRLALLSDGGNVHTRRWAEYFQAQGDDLLLLSCEDPSSIPAPSRRLGPRISPAFLGYSLCAPAARRILAGWRPDLVNAHFLPNYGWMALWLGRRPWVLSTWGSDILVNPKRSPLHRWRARHVLRAADLITSDARMLSEAICALAGDGVRVLTVPMGVGRSLLDRADLAAERPPVILHNRNLESIYDVGTVLAGLADFLPRHPEWSARFAGDGSQKAALARRAGELGLADRIRWLGRLPREALLDELAQARVYVSASLSDSTSVSLLEAMALGVYPVLSDIPANREWIAAPPAARYFPCGSAEGLAKALEEALAMDAPALRAALAANRREVAARAVWEDNMGTLRSAYLGLLGAR